MTKEEWLDQLEVYLKANGLRLTNQRRLIAEAFYSAEDHLDMESLYTIVKQIDATVGQATVYRTLRLLVDSGLASQSNFGGASAHYEVADGEHHDHLICISCRKIVEFHNETIEHLQDEIAAMHGFVLKSHKMELYGKCADCRDK